MWVRARDDTPWQIFWSHYLVPWPAPPTAAAKSSNWWRIIKTVMTVSVNLWHSVLFFASVHMGRSVKFWESLPSAVLSVSSWPKKASVLVSCSRCKIQVQDKRMVFSWGRMQMSDRFIITFEDNADNILVCGCSVFVLPYRTVQFRVWVSLLMILQHDSGRLCASLGLSSNCVRSSLHRVEQDNHCNPSNTVKL